MLTHKKVMGAEIAPYVKQIASLRIKVFREFPYLYDGTEEYENAYLNAYVESPRSIITLAFDGNNLAGAVTTIPLADQHDEIKHAFEVARRSVADVFYCGELMLYPQYRRLGEGLRLFAEVEPQAKAMGMKQIALATIRRAGDHPHKPQDYRMLDDFWYKNGYQIDPTLESKFCYKDITEKNETLKVFDFWIKSLA